MLFSVIYSVDAPEDEDITRFTPPSVGKLWYEMEGDESFELMFSSSVRPTGM